MPNQQGKKPAHESEDHESKSLVLNLKDFY